MGRVGLDGYAVEKDRSSSPFSLVPYSKPRPSPFQGSLYGFSMEQVVEVS